MHFSFFLLLRLLRYTLLFEKIYSISKVLGIHIWLIITWVYVRIYVYICVCVYSILSKYGLELILKTDYTYYIK